ncbi:GNAT family N-acetyltransferase [Microbacterium sp.]|uniref:GNAT family N-acetyltransferase n=1 Tax=Microbacterium sp. TaxID=51671 RepID=UPI0026121514|nr:GNAT family N-acetyltransferase [Microbacterium sp.]
MKLESIWPLFGLEIAAPRIVLRPVRDEDLPGLAQAALAGVHEPDRMPFDPPWTDADPADLPRNLAEFQWSRRGKVSAADWTISFAVHFDGRIVGAQDVSARDFPARRTVNTGSWLTASVHGQGLGTEMRAAVLMFAFDELGAEWAESGAKSWNQASLGVSRKLGYELNGVTRVAPRSGEPVDEQRVRLEKTAFVRPDWAISTRGAAPVLAQLRIPVR